jgi:hypothetical protein
MQTEKKGSKDITPALSKHNAGPEDWLLLSNRNRKTHHEFECTGHVRTAKGCQIIRKHSSFVIQTNGCQKLDVWAGQRLGFFVKGMTATPPPPPPPGCHWLHAKNKERSENTTQKHHGQTLFLIKNDEDDIIGVYQKMFGTSAWTHV